VGFYKLPRAGPTVERGVGPVPRRRSCRKTVSRGCCRVVEQHFSLMHIVKGLRAPRALSPPHRSGEPPGLGRTGKRESRAPQERMNDTYTSITCPCPALPQATERVFIRAAVFHRPRADGEPQRPNCRRREHPSRAASGAGADRITRRGDGAYALSSGRCRDLEIQPSRPTTEVTWG
jgi:hypothetical protein